jgi:hypothetical protein
VSMAGGVKALKEQLSHSSKRNERRMRKELCTSRSFVERRRKNPKKEKRKEF